MISLARKKQETLVLFPEVMVITRKFSDEQFGILMRAAFSYRFAGEVYSGDDVAVDVAFRTVASQIDRYQEFCNTQSMNAKGSEVQPSAAKYSQMKPKSAKYSQSKPSDPPIHVQSMSNPCPIQSIKSKADKPPSTHTYGTYKNVIFSDGQLEELKRDFPSDWEQRIERLSEYMESTGKQYRNHLATIRMWAKEESPNEPERGEQECMIPSL